jgi:hypothetical protein
MSMSDGMSWGSDGPLVTLFASEYDDNSRLSPTYENTSHFKFQFTAKEAELDNVSK